MGGRGVVSKSRWKGDRDIVREDTWALSCVVYSKGDGDKCIRVDAGVCLV